MRSITWLAIAGVFALYGLLVALFGFAGPVAVAVHFSRVSIAVAVLILYVPAISTIFAEVPPPRRDYLLAGIIATWLSGVCFSFWNEAGRVFSVDTSIFSSPIAGLFSLILVVGGAFHLIAANVVDEVGDSRWAKERKRIIALALGISLGAGLVFIAPLFR